MKALEIAASKAKAGERLNLEDALALYEQANLLDLGAWARAANDAECLAIWAETRDRFLGRSPAQSTPGPDGER